MAERRWIKRSEIAEIHESIARNLYRDAREDPAKDNEKNRDHADDHMIAAQHIRDGIKIWGE